MEYKTEPHLHVAEVSPCSMLKAEKMIELYHEAGYKTVFVTDHMKKKYTDSFGDIPWCDKMTIFMSGYYRAKQAAKKYGMNVLPSVEFAFEENLENHYLAYGITKEFLCSYPDICSLGIEKFSKLAKENGILLIQAHPFRDGKSTPTSEFVDGFEIKNANPRHEDFSDKSEELAKKLGLLMTAGSDAHRPEDVGVSGIITDTEIVTSADFIQVIKGGKATLIL